MTRLPWFAWLGTVLACYAPTTEAPCTVACDFSGDKLCPADLTCGPAGMCGTASNACGAQCYGQGMRVCLAASPPRVTFDVGSGGMEIDTTDGGSGGCITYPQAGSGQDVCLIAAQRIAVDGPLTVTGTRPLALLAADTLTVGSAGSIDAAAHVARVGVRAPGAGAAGAVCPAGGAATGNANGGPGGSFGTGGGEGGVGASGGNAVPPGPVTTNLVVIRAGCPGSPGESATGMGVGGGAGGAVYLIAGTALTVAGSINASGGGGPFAPVADGGGAGGGAGGLIGLDAPSFSLSGSLMANGGGGSCGTLNAGDMGCGGEDPAFGSDSFVPARGGRPEHPGGSGGDGGDGDTNAKAGAQGGSAATQSVGGGGGGGGAGIIFVAGPAPGSGFRASPTPVHR